MEITLSQFDDETDPEEADFLAQTSQKGSGTEDEPVEMTTPQPSDVSQPEVAEVQIPRIKPDQNPKAGDICLNARRRRVAGDRYFEGRQHLR